MPTVNLTNEQITLLRLNVLETIQIKRQSMASWEELSRELGDEGTPLYPNAGPNAGVLDREIAALQAIYEALGG